MLEDLGIMIFDAVDFYEACFSLRIGNRTRVLHVFGSSSFYVLFQSRGFMFSLDVAQVDYGCVLRWMILFCVSFCFICYMFCAVFLWSFLSRGFGGVGGVGNFANMSLIEHKRITCFALCFCGLSRHGVSGGGWGILQTCLR